MVCREIYNVYTIFFGFRSKIQAQIDIYEFSFRTNSIV